MIDPVLVRAISLAFAALFMLAAWHKLREPEQFRESVRNYQLVPGFIVPVISMALPVLELMLGVAWLSAVRLDLAAYGSVALLALYAISMGINLMRGRIYIGCGCGMTTTSAQQPLSLSLIFRNLLLMSAALLTTAPAAARTFGFIDYLTLSMALIATTLLYIAASELLSNRTAMASWSRHRD